MSTRSGWHRGTGVGATTSEGAKRRSHQSAVEQWNVEVVKGKVNGKCLWNACKALSLGLLLMVLGAAMATIGYYADHLSMAQEVRGNHTVAVKNERRGFHLNNLSYAGPIVMGVGGFIVVAACVMTFEARDSAAKVVPARLKMSMTGAPSSSSAYHGAGGHSHSVIRGSHGSSMRNSSSQNAGPLVSSSGSHHGSIHGGHYDRHDKHHSGHHSSHHVNPSDRHALMQSFVQFSRGLSQMETCGNGHHQIASNSSSIMTRRNTLNIKQGSINRSPSAPDLILEKSKSDQSSPIINHRVAVVGQQNAVNKASSRRTFAANALLNPGLLHRHALSVDETAANYRSNESLQHGLGGSQGSMAMDLHLECPVTLKVKDKRKNPPLKRQRKIEDAELQQHHMQHDDGSRRSSHSCSPRLSTQYHLRDTTNGGSTCQLPTCSTSMVPHHQPGYHYSRRRSSNASECSHRSRSRRKEHSSHHAHRTGHLERAISSESRLPETSVPRCYHSYEPSRNNSTEQESVPVAQASNSETDVRQHKVMVHFSPTLMSKFDY